jgi:CheY-like chemotaxis protein
MSGFKAFGVEASFVKEELDRAVGKQAADVSKDDRSRVLRRASNVAAVLQGSQILWVDDNPDNNINERNILRSLGVFVDIAHSTTDALEMLGYTLYDLIISDMARDGVKDEGLRLLSEMQTRGVYRWTIFYVGQLDPSKGVPAHAFGITNRPDHLLHFVMDIMERERS